MMDIFGRYPARSVHGRVVQEIGQQIVSGEIKAGEALPREADLMDHFGVSRTAIRDAFKVLAAKGLLKTRQKAGTAACSRDHWNLFDADVLAWSFSAGFDSELIRDLVELRQATEPITARFAAARASYADLAAIEAAYLRMKENVGNRVAYLQADRELHMAIFNACHNEFLMRLGSTIHNILKACFHSDQLYQDRDEEDLIDFLKHDLSLHFNLITHIHRGEPSGAEEAMHDIITFAKSHMIKTTRRLRMAGATERQVMTA